MDHKDFHEQPLLAYNGVFTFKDNNFIIFITCLNQGPLFNLGSKSVKIKKYFYTSKFQVSDPCILNIEGVLFGITSADVLFHLGKEEISFPPHSGDRLRRLANHLVQQRSFYPLFPPNEELSIDLEMLEAHGQVSCISFSYYLKCFAYKSSAFKAKIVAWLVSNKHETCTVVFPLQKLFTFALPVNVLLNF